MRVYGCKGMDTTVLDANFEIQRQAMFGEICGCVWLCTHRVGQRYGEHSFPGIRRFNPFKCVTF